MLDQTTRRAGPFSGEGLKTLPFSFRIFDATDIIVIKALISKPLETATLQPGVDYTVSMNTAQTVTPGGSVTLTRSLTFDEMVVVISGVPYDQTVQLTNFSRFPPEIVTTGFDRIVAQIQQLADAVDRCIKVGEMGTESADELKKLLLTARDLANQILPYKDVIELIASDFKASAETHFNHDFGIWGQDDTTVRLPAGGVLTTVAENASFIIPVGKNINEVIKVAGRLDDIAGLAPLKTQLEALGPISASINALGPVKDHVTTCATNIDAISALGGTLGLTVESTTLAPGSQATVTKTVEPNGYKLTFGIPKGDKGDKGDVGDTGPRGLKGLDGVKGRDGYHFTPSVAADGTLTWTNDGGLANPAPVNIKGPRGDVGPVGPAYSAQTLLVEFEKLIDFGTINGVKPTSFQEYITAIAGVMVNLEQEPV